MDEVGEMTRAVIVVAGGAVVVSGIWWMLQVAERMEERARKRDQQRGEADGGVQD